MLLSAGMSEQIFRTLTLPDGTTREGVLIMGFSPRGQAEIEKGRYVDDAVELFTAICALVGPNWEDQTVARGKLQIKFHDRVDYYFRPHVHLKEKNTTTRLIFGLGLASGVLSNDFDVASNKFLTPVENLDYKPAEYDPNAIVAMLAIIRAHT